MHDTPAAGHSAFVFIRDLFVTAPAHLMLLLMVWCAAGCDRAPWNSPYPAGQLADNIYFSAFINRPKHLDPVRSYSEDEWTFIAQIYEPPLQYHFLKRPYELVPLAAAEMPGITYYNAAGEIVAPGTDPDAIAFSEYTIHLQQGIRYQPHPALAKDKNGHYRYHSLSPADLADIFTLGDFAEMGTREAVAADYIYQIKRMADPRLHCPISGVLAEYLVGFREYQQQVTTYTSENPEATLVEAHQLPLEGVTLKDRYTFCLRLHGKYPQFMYWLATPFFAPIPWEAEAFYRQQGMEEKNLNLDWYPLGTGPYMLTENNPNLRMVLSVNPHFHGERYPSEGEPGDREAELLEDAGKDMPFIRQAVYTREKENIPYWNKFLQGYYDVSGVTSDAFDQAIRFQHGEAELSPAMRRKGIQLKTSVQTTIFYIGFNWLDPVVGGGNEEARLLRQAVSIAIDWEEYISIFRNGRGIAAQGPIPPGIFGHEEGPAGINPSVYTWTGHGPRRKSVAHARNLLAKAGYPGGVDEATGDSLTLYFDTTGIGPDAKHMLNWLRKQFNKLGIQLVIRNTDYNRFQEKMLNGTAQIFMWGWNADYPDPENFLFLLYGPNAKAKENGENAANYQNKRFDRLFERMRAMDNTPERRAIIQQMVDIVRKDAPWSFGFHPKGFSLHHNWYDNVKINLMANNTLKYRRVNGSLRFEKARQWNQPVLWPLAFLGILLAAVVTPAFIMYRRRQRSRIR
jgi:ABC-type transport system substrate-binding protein